MADVPPFEGAGNAALVDNDSVNSPRNDSGIPSGSCTQDTIASNTNDEAEESPINEATSPRNNSGIPSGSCTQDAIASNTNDEAEESPSNEATSQSSRPRSPAGHCTICLDSYENKSYIASCRHFFCFDCICEWGMEKNVCPLCKRRFNVVIHNIRADDDFDRYFVADTFSDSFNIVEIPDEMPADAPSPWNRVTPSNPNYREILRLYAQIDCLDFTSLGDIPVVDGRELVYQLGLYAMHPTISYWDVPMRKISLRRVAEVLVWIERDLLALLTLTSETVADLLIDCSDILYETLMVGPILAERLLPHLGNFKELFMHELFSFVDHGWDVERYDSHAEYTTRDILLQMEEIAQDNLVYPLQCVDPISSDENNDNNAQSSTSTCGGTNAAAVASSSKRSCSPPDTDVADKCMKLDSAELTNTRADSSDDS